MNVPIDTLAFAKNFEDLGFAHDQAHALAAAFGTAHAAGREDLVTKDYLNGRLGEMEVRLVKQIAENGRDISARLWSTVTIIAGVSTAISATIGAGVALLLHAKGL
jgi:hypothetical protein